MLHSTVPELVPISAGRFLMGTSHAQIRHLVQRFGWGELREMWKEYIRQAEQPQHEVSLPAYEISRYPVTQAQFAAFVCATGYEVPFDPLAGIEGGAIADPPDDHPVVKVRWDDAQAYLAWLRQWSGRPFRLPTEAEWEKAARGTDARHWPWGDEWDPTRCNCDENGLYEATPVNQYSPAGDSPYGCVDMVGNVWEWTQSQWGRRRDAPKFRYPYDPKDDRENVQAGEEMRWVLRGGAFNCDSWSCRCAFRRAERPDFWEYDLGFRVAVSGGSL